MLVTATIRTLYESVQTGSVSKPHRLVDFLPIRRPARGFFLFSKEFVSHGQLLFVVLLRVLIAANWLFSL
jgi:hypothetical protein